MNAVPEEFERAFIVGGQVARAQSSGIPPQVYLDVKYAESQMTPHFPDQGPGQSFAPPPPLTVYVWSLRTGWVQDCAGYTGVASTESLAWSLLAKKAVDWDLVSYRVDLLDRDVIMAALDRVGGLTYGVSALEVTTP